MRRSATFSGGELDGALAALGLRGTDDSVAVAGPLQGATDPDQAGVEVDVDGTQDDGFAPPAAGADQEPEEGPVVLGEVLVEDVPLLVGHAHHLGVVFVVVAVNVDAAALGEADALGGVLGEVAELDAPGHDAGQEAALVLEALGGVGLGEPVDGLADSVGGELVGVDPTDQRTPSAVPEAGVAQAGAFLDAGEQPDVVGGDGVEHRGVLSELLLAQAGQRLPRPQGVDQLRESLRRGPGRERLGRLDPLAGALVGLANPEPDAVNGPAVGVGAGLDGGHGSAPSCWSPMVQDATDRSSTLSTCAPDVHCAENDCGPRQPFGWSGATLLYVREGGVEP